MLLQSKQEKYGSYRRHPLVVQNPRLVDDERRDLSRVLIRHGGDVPVVKPVERDHRRGQRTVGAPKIVVTMGLCQTPKPRSSTSPHPHVVDYHTVLQCRERARCFTSERRKPAACILLPPLNKNARQKEWVIPATAYIGVAPPLATAGGVAVTWHKHSKVLQDCRSWVPQLPRMTSAPLLRPLLTRGCCLPRMLRWVPRIPAPPRYKCASLRRGRCPTRQGRSCCTARTRPRAPGCTSRRGGAGRRRARPPCWVR